MDKIEFSITFWIRALRNPGWSDLESEIRFPPVTTKDGIRIFCAKYGKHFKVYVLHPEYGYRKLSIDASSYMGKDTFVAVTVKGENSKLYLNSEEVLSLDRKEMSKTIELGDIVMVSVKNGDLSNFKIEGQISVLLPAEVKRILDDEIEFYFFGLKEVSRLGKERIYL